MYRILNSFLFSFFIFFGASIAAYSQDKTPVASPSIENKADDVKAAIDTKTADGNLEELSQEELLKKKLTKKKKPKTKSDIVKGMILTIIGGLGIFLLGMKFMSDGIQTVAGSSLRKLIKTVTDNKYMACTVGVLITVLVQSSSVTTVMAVGFVNSTIMELNQAIGVILGANIGTTITGWILVLKIGKYGGIIIGIATFLYLFTKNEMIKYTAFAIVGIGMVFLGLEMMKNGFSPMKGFPEFIEWFKRFEADSYIGVIKCAMVGCVLTVIVQSSSATLGITIALASVGVIEFHTAAALVLGENIGTTITAYLASLSATTNAKRAAYFHVAFNVIGVAWIIAIFPWYMPFIEWLMASIHGVTDLNEMGVDSEGDLVRTHVSTGIALVHTIFNVTNVIVFLPFTALFAKLLTKYVPDKKGISGGYKTQLDFHMLQSSFAAIEQSSFELEKMKIKAKDMFLDLEKFVDKKKNAKFSKRIFEAEAVLDDVQTEITEFLTEVLCGTLS
ncbi:MAG: Na/Pi cotransporter family protein, partial [Lentisphaeraceae bacterium]|nr:Na/Pi cotransporter family protein [Lentisphaeraceae bacterium]